MELVYIHQFPSLIPNVAELLNKQWPRGEQSRVASLEKSTEGLPLHLALIQIQEKGENEDQPPILLGCSSLAKVVDPNLPNSVLIENVLVDPNLRSKGYGRILMEKTEAIARKLGYITAYLSTTDKEMFYGHLGYQECPPVTTGSGAGSLLSAERMNGIMHLFGTKAPAKGPKVVWMTRTL